jgi:outer membrane protein assembly complex protein YaeT
VLQARILTGVLLAAMLVPACREEDGEIRIASIEFDGVSQVSKGALADALQTKKGSRLPWGRKRYFDRRAYEADLQRIVAFYRDRGFPDARVTSTDLKLNDQKDAIDITLRISEGEPLIVEDVVFDGFDVLPTRQVGRTRRQLPLQPGQPLDTQLASASRERALTLFRDNGYPYAEVQLVNDPVGDHRERVTLRATPGTLARFGPVELNGEASVGENVIRRQLTFEPGDPYSAEKMRESQRKLYRMELFQFVNVESLENREEMTPEVPVRVTVGEGKHRKVNFGVGYGSEERARVRIRWDHVNFFGGARQASAEARWSSLDRGLRLELREPYLFNKNFSLSLQGQAWNVSEPIYSQNTFGGRAVVRYQPTLENYISASIINEYQNSSVAENALFDPEYFSIRDDLIALGLDPETGEAAGTVSALALEAGRNTTNSLLDARRGYVINARLEQAGRFMGGSYNYLLGSIEARHYQTVMRRFVIANRLNIGSVDPVGTEAADIPFHKRFFLGGASSNRGWGRFEVAPLNLFGLPIGGLSMLDISHEVRFPVWGRLGGVVFLDYGNVWSESLTFDLDELQYAVGPGLRYQTPIGPVRIDLGYQLNPVDNLLVNGEPQKRPWRVHFSVGQAF